jgi:group II intron reverse transcriptase/maturase
MSDASTSRNMSPQLRKVAERAKREPKAQFHSLAHLIDREALVRAFGRVRKDAAVGVDGVTKEQYGQKLERNLAALHERLRTQRYRHQPIKRVHIPKDKGKTRPIGIAAVEDKIVEDAIREVLEAVYEQDFLDCSYGFRRGRSAHDAIRALQEAMTAGEASWILEADIVSYFDRIDRAALTEMLRDRVPDGSLMRLVGKCLRVGVLDGEEFASPEVGTPQGSILSPLLGNVYLHHVLDLWFEREVKPRLVGRATLVRYADDLTIGFTHREDAERVMRVLEKRMGRFGLTLHPDKTRVLDFRRPGRSARRGPSTFDFLGFTWRWTRTRKGTGWRVACETRSARLTRAIKSIYDWCRGHRHRPIEEQRAALARRIQGHMNYFAVSGNGRAITALNHWARCAWFKWLRRRSNRWRLTWAKFNELARGLPQPRIMVRLWGRQ